MFAIIESGGKQYKVQDGDILYIDKINGELDSEYVFNKVLLIGGSLIRVGSPYVEDAKVTAVIQKQGRSKKLTVFKYKPKKNQYKKQGHRQHYTKLLIKSIVIK